MRALDRASKLANVGVGHRQRSLLSVAAARADAAGPYMNSHLAATSCSGGLHVLI